MHKYSENLEFFFPDTRTLQLLDISVKLQWL